VTEFLLVIRAAAGALPMLQLTEPQGLLLKSSQSEAMTIPHFDLFTVFLFVLSASQTKVLSPDSTCG
jgi:hypothetical protein